MLVNKGTVVSLTKIAVLMVKPVDGGVKITSAVCADAAGSLPQMIKDSAAKGYPEGLKKMIHHLQKKKNLPLSD